MRHKIRNEVYEFEWKLLILTKLIKKNDQIYYFTKNIEKIIDNNIIYRNNFFLYQNKTKFIDIFPEDTPNYNGKLMAGYQNLIREEIMLGKYRKSF